LRVLIVTHYLGEAAHHGLERVVSSLASELSRLGDRVAIATTLDAAASAQSLTPRAGPGGIPVFDLSAGALDPLGVPFDKTLTTTSVDRLLDIVAPDVVHITLLHGLHPDVVEHIRRRRIPVLLDEHSYESGCPQLLLYRTDGSPCSGPDGGLACARACYADLDDAVAVVRARNRLFVEATRAADARSANSRFVSRWMADQCDIPEPEVIAPPVAVPAGGALGTVLDELAVHDRLMLATIGGVKHQKGPQLVVEALESAVLGPCQLLVLGPISEPDLLREMRRRAAGVAGLELRVVGTFLPRELSLMLSGVDALVLPVQSPETYSISAHEAWCRSIPVLASRLGALGESVLDGVNGFTFDHRDAAELGALLKRLVDEPQLLPALRAGAAQTSVSTPEQHARAVRDLYAAMLDRTDPLDVVFSSISERGAWRLGDESDSGPGSQPAFTRQLQAQLPLLVRRLGVRRLLDVGCGDFNWMREIELELDMYIGVDVVFDVILTNRIRYAHPRRRFLMRDLMRDPLPGADLVLCRDVLIHFPNELLIDAMHALFATGARYMLATTFLEREENVDIELGEWRPTNLQLPPLSLPHPAALILETPSVPGYEDKRLALWNLDELRAAWDWV
jgi:glycosyltransferase involved in cell wall biosynthesis